MKLPKLNIKSIKLPKLPAMTKTQKILTLVVTFVLLADIIAAVFLIANKNQSAVRLAALGEEKANRLYALDSSASKGTISKPGYANFKFTEQQKKVFQTIYNKYGTAALVICLQVMPTKEQQTLMQDVNSEAVLNYGFLTNEDFTKKGKLKKQYYPGNKRIQVIGDLKKAPDIFDVAFAVQKNENIEKTVPEGFFVYTSVRCRILGACVVPAEVGFDITKDIPFYGFACNGGVIDFDNRGFDFSGASMIFPVQASVEKAMPEFSIILSDAEDLKTTREHSVRLELNIGGEKLYVNNVPSAKEIVIPTGALNVPFSRTELGANSECINALIMRASTGKGSADGNAAEEKVNGGNKNEVLDPIRTDPGLILNYKTTQWRTPDYEIYEWDRYPGILFFDTRNYEIQDRLFRRLAYYVEKQGYKGRLLTNEELGDMHGYNAHDYSAASMANFFNQATDLNFQLNEEEILLKRILIHNGLFENDGLYVKANEGGLVSISRETPGWSRINLLAHEGWHTIFFRDPEFRNYVSAVYYTFDPTSLEFLIDYFKSQPSLGYDVNDEYLMHNEFMAYIMQQRLSEVANYFVHLANRGSVIEYTPQLAAYIRKTEGRGFEDAANALNDFVYDKYGIVCGNIALVNR